MRASPILTTPLLKVSSEDEPVKNDKTDDTRSPATIAVTAPATARAEVNAFSGTFSRPSKKPLAFSMNALKDSPILGRDFVKPFAIPPAIPPSKLPMNSPMPRPSWFNASMPDSITFS